MTKIKQGIGSTPPETRERLSEASRKRHDENIQRNIERLREAMRVIQTEMAGNHGIYPKNKGVISQAEVARRAELHPVTLHKPYYATLVAEVHEWVAALKVGAVVGHKRVKKALQSRVQEHEDLRLALQESHRCTELDLDVALENLTESQARCRQLEAENQLLRQQLAKTAPLKVVKLSPRKG